MLLLLACAPKHDLVDRTTFNRLAVRRNEPVYWVEDTDHDATIDPAEVVALLFYPTVGAWTADGAFTPGFEATYAAIADEAAHPPALDPRQALLADDLDAGRPTLVLTRMSQEEQDFARHMVKVADLIDGLYDRTTGAAALRPQVPADALSQSAFRRNRGPECVGPATKTDPRCSAIPGAPKRIVDVYPAALQTQDGFCAALEARPDASALTTPFAVVRGDTTLTAVPYHEAYASETQAIAEELRAASAAAAKLQGEAALVTYLDAAARGFVTDDWVPADEAWSRMNTENSKWYVRVGPDETYWEPCAFKAGYHLTYARINRASLAWQEKLTPLLGDMERAVATAAGPPYVARDVQVHLPDFIDIVVNAGDDRDGIGATIGQSLPNWGPVADEGRGRTVAMSNLFVDPDSVAARREQASAILTADALHGFSDDAEPGLLSTILHEATHNLGPAADYRADGKNDLEAFGGQTAAMLEELKAQTGALYLLGPLQNRGVVSAELARGVQMESLVWAFGHISDGMYDADGSPDAYAQLAAVQVGILVDEGALRWDPQAKAANGTDIGAFQLDRAKLGPAIDSMMQKVGGIQARGDRAAAEALVARYVNGDVLPMKEIAERFNRTPKGSVVYAVEGL